MRAARLLGLALLVGVLWISVPALGTSATPTRADRADACGRVEFISGLEAVFGRFRTHQQALAFRTQVTGRGFINANIIESCTDFRVVIRGIDTFDVGVDLQDEARKEGFSVTLECIQRKPLGRWEGILGHGRDVVTANAIVTRAAAAGMPGGKLRNDPCGGFEVYVAGFDGKASAESFATTARSRGFPDAIAELN